LKKRKILAVAILCELAFVLVCLGASRVSGIGCWNLTQATLPGSMQSSPALALSSLDASEMLVVRGATNHVYAAIWNSSTSTWRPWTDLGGSTNDAPAIAFNWEYSYPYWWGFHIVVRGMDNKLYYKSYSANTVDGLKPSWSSWISLGGSTATQPVLVSSLDEAGMVGRLDLVVRGMDDKPYHKHWTHDSGWSSTWDTPGGKTPDRPAVSVLNQTLQLVVRGMTNGIYWNYLNFSTGLWKGWATIPGTTPSGPALGAYLADNRMDLVVRGMNNVPYHKSWTKAGGWSSSWDSLGGSTPDRPVVGYDWPSYATSYFPIYVRGNNGIVYRNNYFWGTATWTGWSTFCSGSLATDVPPSLNEGFAVLKGLNGSIHHYHYVGP
jgi:hypothetical protein